MSKAIIRGMIEMGRDALANTAQAVPQDKRSWKPLENGRSVQDLLGDAAQGPQFGIILLTRPADFSLSPETFQRMKDERTGWTFEQSLEKLESNTNALLGALDQVSEEKLNEPVTMPIGPGVTLPLGQWLLMTYRTFAARTGQINYIQTLYGDYDHHEFKH